MPLVNGKVIDGVGRAVDSAFVTVTPVPALVLVPSADAEMFVPGVFTTFPDGTWQANLVGGTTYMITYHFGRYDSPPLYIQVPDTLVGSFWVGDLRVDAPCTFPGGSTPGGDTGMITVLEDGVAVVSNVTGLDFLSPGWTITDEGGGIVSIAMIASGVNALQLNGINIDTGVPLNGEALVFDGTQYSLTQVLRAIDVGTVTQPFSDLLAAIDAAGSATDRIAYYTGTDAVSLAVLSAFARTILASADADTALAALTAIGQAEKNQADGVAGLDSNGLLVPGVLPPDAIVNTFTVANQASMLLLGAQTGDLAFRTDLQTAFILAGTDPTNLADWKAFPSQPGNANLTAIAGLTTAADKITVWTGAGTAALFDITSMGRAILAQVRDTFSNANKVCGATTATLAQVGTMTASRTVTLPAANAYPAGVKLLIVDESGSVTSTNSIVINRAGADLIDGNASITISFAYGWRMLESDGSSKWTVVSASADATDVTALPLGTKPSGAELIPASQSGAGVALKFLDMAATLLDAQNGTDGLSYINWDDFDGNVQANTTDATNYGGLKTVLNLNVGGGTGAGAAAQQHAVELVGGHPIYGVGQLTTGTGTTARASVGPLSGIYSFQSTDTGVRFICKIRIPTLSDGTNTFLVQAGLLAQLTSATHANAIWVEAGPGANWRCKQARASTVSDLDSGVAVSTAAYVNIGIWYDGTTVRYYISTGTSPLTQVQSGNAQLPTNGSVLVPGILLIKSAGATARTLNIDGWGSRLPVSRGLGGFRL